MNESNTFEALVDAVSEQTGKPRGVCRSFIAELGSAIPEILEEEGNIIIDGLGTFSRQEKESGASKSSLSFQPSEELQELVNAPYAHMGPEIIEEPEDNQPADEEKDSGESTEETGEQDHAPAEHAGPESVLEEASAQTSTLSFKNKYRREQKTQGSFWIIAAAFIILLLAAGAWYLIGILPETSDATEQMAVENTQTTEDQQPQTPRSESESQQNDEEQPETDGEEQSTQNSQSDDTREPEEPDEPGRSNQVITVTVQSGQTLWGLANNQYKNPYLWPWIYDTNKESIEDPDIIYVGQPLDIPFRGGSNGRLSDSDSLQVALAYVETYLWYKERELENARFYLYAAKRYHNRVFEYTDAEFDEADLQFANRAQ